MFSLNSVQSVLAIILVFLNIYFVTSVNYLLKLTSDAPAITGSLVTFTADLLEANGSHVVVTETLKWEWSIDEHEKQELKTKVPFVTWTYQIPKQSHTNPNPNKAYKLEVSVGQWYMFFSYPLASATLDVNVTSTLNGNMVLKQNGFDRKSHDIAIDEPLEQRLELRKSDLLSIQNATSIIVHWMVDCNHIRQTKEMHTSHLFGEKNRTHLIEALIEASFESLPTKSIPTFQSKLITEWQTAHRNDLPFVCHNRSGIVPDSNKVYGYFHKKIITAEPVNQLILNGTKWYQAGDKLELDMYCSGTPNFEYCIRQLNHTNESNETCDNWTSIKECYQHFSLKPNVGNVKAFSILIFVRNSVSVERSVHIVRMKKPIYMAASVGGIIIFTLIIISAIVCCIVRRIRQRETTTRPSAGNEAEKKLLGVHGVKIEEPKSNQKDSDR